ncbi:MOSC domain-containing protein [Streptosporangium carneum]|nr:MOSC domain-containing protein [Streptosporangium carneum]
MRIVAVNVGRAVDAEWAGKLGRTAIDKAEARGRIEVGPNGLAGDERADVEHHGAPDHAVYSYAREDYDWWQRELGRELRNGCFGENLTTEGLDVNGAVIGERWRVGTAVIEVTGPRVPCLVFRNWLGEKGWIKRFTQAGRVGAYLRVVELGDLGSGDAVEIVARPEGSVTVTESFRAYHGDKELLRRLLAVPGHSPVWDEVADRVLGGRRA